MSRILITGSTGFIGRNLVTYLLKNTEHNLFLINRFILLNKNPLKK